MAAYDFTVNGDITPGLNALAQGFQQRKQRQDQNALGADLPGALGGDTNALARIFKIDPNAGLRVQQYVGAQQEAKRKLTAEEFDALDNRVTQALANTKDDAEAAALWPKLHAYAAQALGGHPEALAMFQQHFSQDYNPVYRQMAVKPQDPFTLNEGDKRFDGAGRLIAEGAPKPVELPADVRGYQFYADQERAAGRQPKSYEDYQTDLRRSGASNVSIDTGQKGLDNELKIRSDFRQEPAYKTFQDVGSAYKQLKAGLAAGNAAGDLAAGTKFMKLLDPGSVVRESELGMAMEATGKWDRLTNLANMYITGQKLTPSQRKEFGDLADQVYAAAQQTYNSKRDEYRDIANHYGMNADRVTGPLEPQAGPSAHPDPAVDALLKKYPMPAGH